MKTRIIFRDGSGQSIVAAVIIMFILSLFGLVAVSLLGTQTGQSAVGLIQSTQALYLAQAGLEWYLQQLADDTDWANQSNPATQALGAGTFVIELSNISSTSMDIRSIGIVVGPDGINRERYVQVNVKKSPKAFKFAVYWGRNTGSTLQIRNNSTINGDFWSRGTTQVQGGSSITGGIAYYAQGQNITGGGSYTKKAITSPPDMPLIDTTYYNNLMNTANSYIDEVPGSASDRIQTTNLTLNGNIIQCRNFVTSGDIAISGYGFIVASRNIYLHSQEATEGTLTITPSGGNIYFLAGRSLVVNSDEDDTNVTINNGAYLYSRAADQNTELVNIRKHSSTTTSVNSAIILGRRRIIVQDGAQVTNSTLYISNVADQNNYLRIADSQTFVSGSVISVADDNYGLRIDDGASVAGLVYHYGGTTGTAFISSATISGCLIASQFYNSRIMASAITYNPSSLTIIPEGFDGYIITADNSYDVL